MKPGAVKMRYPSGDPENGPAYMQQWTGEEWVCFVHKPDLDEEGCMSCVKCGQLIMSKAKVDAMKAYRRKA